MKASLALWPLLMLASPCTTLAASPFTGTWRVNLSESQSATKPEVYLLRDGIYHCQTCDPPVVTPADGHDHPAAGEPCFDSISIKVVNERTIEETDKRRGVRVATRVMIVSTDGQAATDEWTESCNAKGDLVSGKDVLTRVETQTPGSHAISGSWRISQRLGRSDNALVISIALDGDTFSFADPAGQSYVAKLDGAAVPFKGMSGDTRVSVRQPSARVVEETLVRDNKVLEVTQFVVSPDGTTLRASIHAGGNQDAREFVLRKQ
jgi:hypothetical protein